MLLIARADKPTAPLSQGWGSISTQHNADNGEGIAAILGLAENVKRWVLFRVQGSTSPISHTTPLGVQRWTPGGSVAVDRGKTDRGVAA